MDISNIWKFDLRWGNSDSPQNGACLLDAVSWFEYGSLGDHPECVCPVVAAFGRGINDVMYDGGRQRLKEFIPRLVGTVDRGAEQERAEYLAWQAIRVFAPLALDAAGLRAEAAELREFEGLLCDAAVSADAARDAAYAARDAAYAARDAAYAARDAAYAAAARAAARAAAAAHAAAYAYAACAAIDGAMIAALDGVLRIGRQAEPIESVRMQIAAETFDAARCAA